MVLIQELHRLMHGRSNARTHCAHTSWNELQQNKNGNEKIDLCALSKCKKMQEGHSQSRNPLSMQEVD